MMGEEPVPLAPVLPPDPPPDPPDPGPINMVVDNVPSGGLKRRIQDDVQSSAKKNISSSELSVPSIQTVYTHPSFVVEAVNTYTSMDKGPFVVHVSRSSPDPAAGTTIRPIKFGQFLATHKFKNICPDGVKRVGRNKISVQFTSAEDANKFTFLPFCHWLNILLPSLLSMLPEWVWFDRSPQTCLWMNSLKI